MCKVRTYRSPAEVEQIKKLLMTDATFRNCFRKDWTGNVMNDLLNRLYGKIPRNFLINITGLIGTPSGIFKSSMGLQIALKLDPTFNIQQRVAFSANQLLDKIQNNSEYLLCNVCLKKFEKTYSGSYELHKQKTYKQCNNCDAEGNNLILLTKLIFLLDEQTKTLKRSGIMRLMNIVDTNRQRQLCFITCGVDSYEMSFSTYQLLRIQESHDIFLPNKKVRYGVYDDNRKIYYGYFQWNVTPLTDMNWNFFWKTYSVLKTEFQRIAVSQRIQSLDFEEYAQEIIDSDDFELCFHTTKDGNEILQASMVKNLIYKQYPDRTEQDRSIILSEIKFILKKQEGEEDED